MIRTKNNIFISFILSFFILTAPCLNFDLSADVAPSPRRLAAGDFSDDIYDTYDYLTDRLDMLGKINGVHLIFFPDELAGDMETLFNAFHDNPDVNLNNRIGFGYGADEFGFGFHFQNLYIKRYQDPEYKENIEITDNDNDGIVKETNEFQTTTITAITNFNKDNNLNFGGGIGFSAGNITFGMGYQALLKDDILTNYSSQYEYYTNKYSAYVPYKTTGMTQYQSTNKDHQHQVIFNFGVDDITPYLDKNNVILKKREPLFLLETKLIFFEESTINRKKYLRTEDDDPSKKISTTLFNKTEYDGTSTQPNMEERQTSRGTKLHIKPKFNIAVKKDLNLNMQFKFGIGFNIKNSYLKKSSSGINVYQTDGTKLYQDIVTNKNENILDCSGDGNYYMYGLRFEQIFKPKYFTIGIALDATVQQNISKLSGTSKIVNTIIYGSTYTNYKMSPNYFGIPQQTFTVESPNLKAEKKITEVNTTISVPVGFEFELAKYIKLRTSYTFKIENSHTKTVTTLKSDFSTTNSCRTNVTFDFNDPDLSDIVFSLPGTPDYTETTTTEIASENNTSSILSAGFEFTVSDSTSFNVVGSYNIGKQIGQAIIDVKFRL